MKPYLSSMPLGSLTLWCYFIWYLAMVAFHFDRNAKLWANSLGLSAIVGIALVLATGPLSLARVRRQFWQVARLFLCPFCVSSFSALTKEEGFFLLISPSLEENMVALLLCCCFCALVFGVRKTQPAV
ncbi:hypothetical protein [Marinobacterium arenosum]|uniref:hypothetical protein n=1 Tax=Marinobacterium arenosum TaxID=2862496 RepID=UPI001C986BBA|nr:hypothetical protein [Marinobacterium arenosum]MBY4676691.1 hypothetical protein [Marinobacterium arenosum]